MTVNEGPRGESGNIVAKLPLPPGTLPTLWGNQQRYFDTYLSRFEGYYLTGDAGVLDEQGYVWVMSRIDDVINVAGHGCRPAPWKKLCPPTRW